MITLLTYAPAFGEFAASPFCVKAAWLLNLSGEDWQREDLADPRAMPFGKLPAIRADGRIIPDSDAIRAFLESRGARFDTGLGASDKATSRAFIRMSEEHLYFHCVMDRWGNDAVWPVIQSTYFATIPRLLRGMVTARLRKNVLAGMKTQGVGRFSETQRMQRVEPDLQAIAARLGDGPFLFGDHPTAADASVGAMLRGMRATPVATLLQTRLTQDAVLSAYADRCAAAMGVSAGSA